MNRKIVASWISLAMVLSFIVIIIEIAQVVEAPTTWYVDDVPGSGGPENPSEDFTSIQDAINTSQPGDKVFVYNGTYYENVVVNKTINLTGEDRDNTIINGSAFGDVVYINADWVNVSGFTILNSGSGIFLESSNYTTIEGNDFINNSWGGILLDGASNSSIENNNFINNLEGIAIFDSSYVNITHNSFSNNEYGIDIQNSAHINVINNNVTTKYYGIWVMNSYPLNVIDNYISCGWNGMDLSNVLGGDITGNIVKNCEYGIMLWSQTEIDLLAYNNITNCDYGIAIYGCAKYNNILNNNVSNNLYGIYLEDTYGNNITDNHVSDNDYGVFLFLSNQNTIKNNNFFDNDFGIFLLTSSFNTIENNSCISNNVDGMQLFSSKSNTIENNNCSNNSIGIFFNASSLDNILVNNTFLNNMIGIRLEFAGRNKLMNNNCTLNNDYGIFLNQSSNNNIINNNTLFANKQYGIFISLSNDNTIYHNNIINNLNQAYDNGTNNWDNAYPSGGNYWSDYVGVDKFKGPNQDVLGSDGIGDTNYSIDSDSIDNYPLMEAYIYQPLENYTLLKQGWNLISIPLIQNNQSLKKVLEMIDGYYDAVQWYDNEDKIDPWKHKKVGKPFGNDLSKINESMGFWIHITQPGDTIFLYNGTESTVNQTITLHPGWNQVGYPSLTSYNRTEGLNNLTFGTHIDSIWTYNAATQTWKEIGPSDYFEIGRGYWVHAKTKCEWEVPL